MDGFEFRVGDMVSIKTDIIMSTHPAVFQVVARIIEECHGGIQRFYSLAGLRHASERDGKGGDVAGC